MVSIKRCKIFSHTWHSFRIPSYLYPSRLKAKNCIHFSKQKIPMGRSSFGGQTAESIFLNLLFKLFFKYLDLFVVFWMNDLLIYSQTERGQLKHLELVFENLEKPVLNLKYQSVNSSKNRIFRTPSVWPRNIPLRDRKFWQTLTTNITEAQYMICLIRYYWKFFFLYPVIW